MFKEDNWGGKTNLKHISNILVTYLSYNIILFHQFLEGTSCIRQFQARVLWWSQEMFVFARPTKMNKLQLGRVVL